MMTSTFPGSRSGSSQSLKGGLQEIQSKRDGLKSLEAALKRRLNELRELCLKEGEITGQLPGDYPLQPREPIPQVRRRTEQQQSSSSNLSNDTNSISPYASSVSSSHRIDPVQPHSAYVISSNGQVIFPQRPMSTNSTSSSTSTASSNTRSINNQQRTNMLATPTISSSSTGSSNNSNRLNGAHPVRNLFIRDNHIPVQYDHSPMQTTRFKRPQELPLNNFDNESNGLMRASSTASSSSSSGSAASSTLSTATVPSTRLNNNINMLNLHARSCSESMDHPPYKFEPSRAFSLSQDTQANQQQQQQQQYHPNNTNRQLQASSESRNLNSQPMRPPRGLANSNQQQLRKFDSVDGDLKSVFENRYKPPNQNVQKLPESSSLKALQHINIDGKGSFVPYYEETKPFQMSDFYKYSSKHRQKVETTGPLTTKTKTTRQLQEDVKKNPLRYSSCDDQKIQNSMKIIEKSGQKLIEATAKAIAVNPGLAEKINSILPNTGVKY